MTTARYLAEMKVAANPGPDHTRGLLIAGATTVPCALGRGGVIGMKREGDGGTPRGDFGLATVLYRPDRGPRPQSGLPVIAISRDSGWCDDPADRAYNQPIDLPYAASAERLWRDDHVYDLIVAIDYNMHPARPGMGSAIFLHLATPDFAPTAGCVAIAPAAMRRLLPRLGRETKLRIL